MTAPSKLTPPWQKKTCIMGIINCSPDSFYAAQQHANNAIDLAASMVADGADILDIGGEATNPNIDLNQGPTQQQELDRILPVIEAIKQRFDIMICVDTSKPFVMQAALQAGARMINDQRALAAEGAKALVARFNAAVCLMHFPQNRQPGCDTPQNLCQQIIEDLLQIKTDCIAAGIAENNVVIDPGFGQGLYGKNSAENSYMMNQLKQFRILKSPILIGWSRKSMISDICGNLNVNNRLAGSLAAVLWGLEQGASLFRVHDVAQTKQAITIWNHFKQAKGVANDNEVALK